jgi:putative flippase GtrA
MLTHLKKYTSHSFIRFGLVGVTNTAVDFAIFFTLYAIFEWNVVTANVLAFLAAVTNSYLLNKHWAFAQNKTGTPVVKEFLLFLTASLFSLFLSTAILVIGEPFLSVFILKIGAAVIVPLVNYVLYKYLIFSPTRIKPQTSK